MSFDYEEVERDILNAGADPDYLDYNHPDSFILLKKRYIIIKWIKKDFL